MMRKFFYIILMILLSSCGQKELEPAKKIETLAPLEISENDYDTFSINGISYSLPANYTDFEKNGISLNEDEFYYQKISKNGQAMANLKGKANDLGATFKNTSSKAMDIKDSTIIELYINNNNDKNKDFSINGLRWGDSYQNAVNSLKDVRTEEANMNNEKTLNYYTDKNYVSLYFKEDKLSSAAIFSKSFMRDESYSNGEFVIFGQTVMFPLTVRDLEDLLNSNINIDQNYDTIGPGEVISLRIYSPLFENNEQNPNAYGVDFDIKNTSHKPISIKDAQIISLTSENSSDLSVGNIYVGASIDELKKMDKKNQNPRRLNIEGKIEDNLMKFVFNAKNDTDYTFHTDEEAIKHIKIVNKKEQ